MRPFDELESRWRALHALPQRSGSLRLIVVRKGGGVHETPAAARLTAASGLQGDRWVEAAGRSVARQVTLMMASAAELCAASAVPLHTPGDNLLVDLDLSEAALPVGARVRIGSAVIEVSAAPHLGCSKFAARFGDDALRWVNAPEHRARRLRGCNGSVVVDGDVAVGDAVTVL